MLAHPLLLTPYPVLACKERWLFFFPEFSSGLQHMTPKSFRSELSPEQEHYSLSSYWTSSIECSGYHRIKIFKTEPIIFSQLTRPAFILFYFFCWLISHHDTTTLQMLRSWLFQQFLEPITSSLNLMGTFLLFSSHLDPLCLCNCDSSHRSVSL